MGVQDCQPVVRELLRKADTLTDLPQLGRVVPELNDAQFREIPCYAWRILYHLRHGRIYIVTLVHKRKQLGVEEITTR